LHNHFELFGLAPDFALDPEALERNYREIQSRVHPDRFAHAGDAERRASLQWTTRVNEAYRTLTDPVQRAKHILELHGVDVAFETNTQMPSDFLMQQLELREELVVEGHPSPPVEHDVHARRRLQISSRLGTRVRHREPVFVTSATSSMRTPPRPR